MGTIIITGANGSLALPAVEYLLSDERPSAVGAVILTVRNDSEDDVNTEKLRELIAQAPGDVIVQIRKLDLSSLAQVHNFAAEVHSDILAGKIPRLEAVIWNAMTWSLQGGLQMTPDGYERSMAVNHIAHFSLTLELLGSFGPGKGRIVFLGSDSHDKAALQELPSILPDDLDLLVHPRPDEEGEAVSRGFQRYGLSKLVTIMAMYELNRRLVKDGSKVTALAVDPGGLLDSRVFGSPDVPAQWARKISIANFLQPVLQYVNPIYRKCSQAAKDVVDLAVSPEYAGQTGYFLINKKVESSKASQNVEGQRRIWEKSVEWAGIEQRDTVLTL